MNAKTHYNPGGTSTQVGNYQSTGYKNLNLKGQIVVGKVSSNDVKAQASA